MLEQQRLVSVARLPLVKRKRPTMAATARIREAKLRLSHKDKVSRRLKLSTCVSLTTAWAEEGRSARATSQREQSMEQFSDEDQRGLHRDFNRLEGLLSGTKQRLPY